MATSIDTAAARYAEARRALDEALTEDRDARERLATAADAVTNCQEAERRALRELQAAAYPAWPIAG